MLVTWVVMPWIWLSIFNGEAVKWSFVKVKESVSFEKEEEGVRRKGRNKDEDRAWKRHVDLGWRALEAGFRDFNGEILKHGALEKMKDEFHVR